MSRFRTAAEQKRAIEDLRKGLVDIIIGTHRVLSADVVFRDLGLLIIDEEQRFGVTHKEKDQEDEGNGGCADADCHPHPADASYESGGDPGYECAGRGAGRADAYPDVCL